MFEIGNSLREARERRQIEIVQVEQATKIRGKYLRALEEEQFDVLPSQTYVKGFLRTYADYLGLDGQLYVDEYNSRFVNDDWSPRRSSRAASRQRERRVQANVVLLAIVAVLILTVVVIAAWKVSDNGTNGRVAKRTAKRHAVTHHAAVPTPYLEISAVRGPSKVIVNRTNAAGKILFEGTLERGDTQAFNGKRFWLNVAAPENLVITVAGRRVHVAGYRPWVLTVTPGGWRGHPA